MRSYRFSLNLDFDELDLSSNTLVVKNPELWHQITKVLRLNPDSPEDITIITGENTQVHRVKVREITKSQVSFEIVETFESQRELQQQVTYFVPIIKPEAFEWMIRKLTELGVQEIVPVAFERSQSQYVTKLSSDKSYERLRKIIQEATEQCEGSVFAQLKPVIDFVDIDKHTQEGLRIFASERRASLEDVQASMKTLSQKQISESLNLSLIVGPEGGVSASEINILEQNSWLSMSLGSRLLKAETAAIALFSRLESY